MTCLINNKHLQGIYTSFSYFIMNSNRFSRHSSAVHCEIEFKLLGITFIAHLHLSDYHFEWLKGV